MLQPYCGSPVEILIEKVKEELALYCKIEKKRVISRPILPNDLGMSSWIWDKTDKNFEVPDDKCFVFSGIYCSDRLYAHVEVDGRWIAILVPNIELLEGIPWFGPNEAFVIRLRYLDGVGASENPTMTIALLGWVIETWGRTLAPKGAVSFDHKTCKACGRPL